MDSGTAIRSRRRSALLGQALVTCLSDQSGTAIAQLEGDPLALTTFVRAADHHGIPGYAYRAMRSAGTAEEFMLPLRGGFHGALAEHLRTMAELRTVRKALDGAGVDWVVAKGPVLAAAHDGPGLRRYSDLDVFVRPAHLPRALESFEAAGATTLDRNWELLSRELRGEVHVVLPYGTVIDLHWHLINQPRERSRFEIDVDELFDRRTSVQVDDQLIPTFDSSDTLIHLALHTMLSGADRLIWFKDIERVLATRPPDWSEVAKRCASWGTNLVVSAALSQTAALLPAHQVVSPLPRPSRVWSGLLRATSAINPPERATGRGSLARMAAKSTAATMPGSVAELARKMALAAREGGLAGRSRGVDPRSCGSMRFDAGGRQARNEFFRAVEGQSRHPIPSIGR